MTIMLFIGWVACAIGALSLISAVLVGGESSIWSVR